MSIRLRNMALMTALIASFALAATAADEPAATSLSADGVLPNAKFAVHVDVAVFRKTPLGSKLFDLLRETAVKEIVKKEGDEETPEKIKGVLGFDPFDEIRGFTLVGSDYEHPEKNLALVVEMGKTTGNLEGLLLSLPGYQSSSHGDYLIHSAAPDGPRVFGAVHTDSAGLKTIAVASSVEDIPQLLDAIDGKAISQRLNLRQAENCILSLRVDELPMNQLEPGPPSNVARLMQQVAVVVTDQAGDFDCKLIVTAKQENQAEQLQQMAQGLVAMVAFVNPDKGEEEKIKALQQLVQGVQVERKGSDVILNVKVSGDLVRQFLIHEANLSL
jgi:hypothetical protein